MKSTIKSQEVENTQKEIHLMQAIDCITYIDLKEIEQSLANIGLKLDLDEKSYLLLYYNTSNERHYYQATTSPKDSKEISAYNVNSDFYNTHLKGERTNTGKILDDLRKNCFTTIRKRGIDYILSF